MDNTSSLYGKKLNIIVDDGEFTPDIGIDTDDGFFENIVNADGVNTGKISQFSQMSQRRDQLCDLIDSMCEDSKVAQALDIYAQCATESNADGNVIWATSDIPEVSKFVSYLLQTMNVDKYVYDWVYCLAKYGDTYLHIYRESELEDIFAKNNKKTKDALNEDIILKAYRKNDKYSHYVEMHQNPSEIFELTRHGKTYAYIEAPVQTHNFVNQSIDPLRVGNTYNYSFKKNDIILMGGDECVHACLGNPGSRIKETVSIFDDADGNEYEYSVRHGKSILYDVYRAWRVLNLLENSMALNRVTKSSIIRVIGVKVGAMGKEEVKKHLYTYKNMIEQKSALNIGKSVEEYNSPAPQENFIITAIRDNDQGNITFSTIGGDVDVKGIADVDYFKNAFYGALGIPKQYMGDTDDAGGFDAGKSLSLISSIFAKRVKRLQQSIIGMVTDVLNLMLLNKGLDSYVNKFKVHMQEPTTQEELDRRDAYDKQLGNVSTIMDLLSDIDNQPTRLKIVNALLSPIIYNSDVTQYIQEEIDNQIQIQEKQNEQEEMIQQADFGGGESDDTMDLNTAASSKSIDFGDISGEGREKPELAGSPKRPEIPEPKEEGGGGELPSIPSDIDFTDNSNF